MVIRIVALFEDAGHASAMKSSLEAAGYELLVIDTFTKAKEVLKLIPCDVILSDVHLENGGSVFDFLRWVKTDARLSSIPFVLVSLKPTMLAKYLSDGVRTCSRVLGAAKYISMDTFDSDRLLKEIAELLSGETVVDGIPKNIGDYHVR